MLEPAHPEPNVLYYVIWQKTIINQNSVANFTWKRSCAISPKNIGLFSTIDVSWSNFTIYKLSTSIHQLNTQLQHHIYNEMILQQM